MTFYHFWRKKSPYLTPDCRRVTPCTMRLLWIVTVPTFLTGTCSLPWVANMSLPPTYSLSSFRDTCIVLSDTSVWKLISLPWAWHLLTIISSTRPLNIYFNLSLSPSPTSLCNSHSEMVIFKSSMPSSLSILFCYICRYFWSANFLRLQKCY